MNTERKCKYCGDTFTGRVDKQFCIDACRNAYHNDRHAQRADKFRPLLNQIKSNYRLLQLLEQDSGKVTVDDLSRLGFKFEVMTHQTDQPEGRAVCCFDYAYRLRGQWVEIFRHPF